MSGCHQKNRKVYDILEDVVSLTSKYKNMFSKNDDYSPQSWFRDKNLCIKIKDNNIV